MELDACDILVLEAIGKLNNCEFLLPPAKGIMNPFFYLNGIHGDDIATENLINDIMEAGFEFEINSVEGDKDLIIIKGFSCE